MATGYPYLVIPYLEQRVRAALMDGSFIFSVGFAPFWFKSSSRSEMKLRDSRKFDRLFPQNPQNGYEKRPKILKNGSSPKMLDGKSLSSQGSSSTPLGSYFPSKQIDCYITVQSFSTFRIKNPLSSNYFLRFGLEET